MSREAKRNLYRQAAEVVESGDLDSIFGDFSGDEDLVDLATEVQKEILAWLRKKAAHQKPRNTKRGWQT